MRDTCKLKNNVSAVFIDDDPNIVRVVCLLCERYGGVIMQPLHSAEEGIDWLLTHPTDVIITDFEMPKINGIEMMKIINSYGITAPCIIFSAANFNTIIRDAKVSQVEIFGIVSKDGSIRSQIPTLMELIIEAGKSNS